MIDRATGCILIEGMTIGPDLTRSEFIEATSMPSSEWLVRGNRRHGSIHRPWHGRDWRFSVTYVGEVLHCVGMGYAKGGGGSYAKWLQFHSRNLADYEKLLVTWLGDWRRKFPWGTATVWFDEKGVGSGIFVEYRK